MSQSKEWSEVIAALESAIEMNKMMTVHLRLYGMKAEDGEKLTFEDIAGPTKDGLLASYRTEFETALTNLRKQLGGGE